jgi:hypothetical protein
MIDTSNEAIVVEEFAASLVDFVVESVGGTSMDATTEALEVLGVLDGDEVDLPASFEDDTFAGQLIAEALLARPELYDVLSAMGSLLVKRIKLGE